MEVAVVEKNQSLLAVVGQLKNAIEKEDWDDAKKIDKHIKANIEHAVLNADNDSDKKELIDLLTKIQSLYKYIINDTEESRAKLSVELKKITGDRKVANFYLKSSLYR
tara:strand:+ start:68 stop:391 length:324 start_codon:yes stop_codon:yes gene_type:complete